MFGKIKRIRRTLNWLAHLEKRSETFDFPQKSDYKHTKVLVGAMLSRLALERPPKALRDVEFQVFSQFGDDGIIQYLIHSLGITERTFIEFGVENYVEANTRFLLVKDKWAGLVLDGDPANVEYIKNDIVSHFYNLQSKQAFITAENINVLISEAGFNGKIGFLSVDIDGMDYWVWKAITVVDPAIVVVEYNAAMGPDRAIAVPYRPDFERAKAHPSRLYWGASLAAFQSLAAEKGYTFVGCNMNGNNAYFVRNEYASMPAVANLERGFNPATFAEYVVNGRPIRGSEILDVIRGLPIYDVHTSSPGVI